MKFPISLFALATLTACVSAGVKVDQSKLAEFHKGKTTYQEVVQELGKRRWIENGHLYVSQRTSAAGKLHSHCRRICWWSGCGAFHGHHAVR